MSLYFLMETLDVSLRPVKAIGGLPAAAWHGTVTENGSQGIGREAVWQKELHKLSDCYAVTGYSL